MTIAIINPTNLNNPKHNKILYHFLMQNKDKKYFGKNILKKVTINGKEYKFILDNDILHRISETSFYKDRFEIIANQSQLGKGSFGEIGIIEGTLAPTPNQTLIFKNHIKRVDKKQTFENKYYGHYTNLANREKAFYNLSNPWGGVKSPIHINGVDYTSTHMLMHLLEGKDLRHFINYQYFKTVDDMLKWSIALLHVCQEYVHDKDLVHCDVKPENIFIDINTGCLTLLDFNLTVKKDEPIFGCTPLYYGDNLLNQLANESHDMRAIGLILAEIWGILEIKKDEIVLGNYFDQLPLERHHQEIISKELYKLIADKPDKKSLADLLEMFEQIRISLTKTTEIGAKVLLKQAHKEGVKVRNLYRESIINQSDVEFKKVFLEAISINHKNKHEEELAIKEFVETLNIKAFAGLSTNEALKNKFEEILVDYSNHVIALKNLKSNILEFPFANELKEHVDFLIAEINRVIEKDKKYNVFNLDNMEKLNAKFRHYEKTFSKEIKNLTLLNEQIKEAKQKVVTLKKTSKNDQNLQTILKNVDSLYEHPVVVKTFARDFAELFPQFKGLETQETRKKLKNEIIFIAYKDQAAEFGNKINISIKKSDKPFAETKKLIEACLEVLPDNKRVIKYFIETVGHSIFDDLEFYNKTSIKKKLEAFAKEAMSDYQVFYKANVIKNLSLKFKPNNKFVAYLDKKLKENEEIIDKLDKNIVNKLNYSAQANFDTAHRMMKIIAPYKKKIDNLIYSKDPITPNSGKRVLIADVFDEWVKAPSNLLNNSLVIATESLKLGILDYINQQYSSVNFLFRQRAASDRRLADMHRILVAINEAPDVNQLKAKVENALEPIQKGFFNRSLLADIIQTNLKNLPTDDVASRSVQKSSNIPSSKLNLR